MSSASIVLTICVIGLMLFCSGARAAGNPMSCVDEITMPYVTPGMVMSLPVDVRVQVLIGADGAARKVNYSAGAPVLQHELDHYFKDGARYRSACEGKEISFTVRYLVEGNKTVRPVSEVRFRPPDTFIVRSHPVMPALDPVHK